MRNEVIGLNHTPTFRLNILSHLWQVFMDCQPQEYGSYPVIFCAFPIMQCLCCVEAILDLELYGSGRQPVWNQAEHIPMMLVP